MHWSKGTAERDVIGQFSTTDAAVGVMERPADCPKKCGGCPQIAAAMTFSEGK